MTCRIDDLDFGGIRGEIQRNKPQFDYYTRYGDDTLYIQKVKEESIPSSISVWQTFITVNEIEDLYLAGLREKLGKRITITVAYGSQISSCYLLDMNYRITSTSGGRYLLEVNLTVMHDSRED